jgi:hypothetical protein
MTVDLGRRKTEAAPFVDQRLEIENLRGRARRLDLVVIDHDDEVAEAVLAG